MLILAATLARAQTNDLTSLLQQGLLEEQANRNLDAAIADYQSLATQYDKNRQVAATAIFRLGECYRMEGRTNEAAAQYQRILSNFSDQQTLATLSRQDLIGMGMGMAAAGAATGTPVASSESSDVALWNKLKEQPMSDMEKILPVLVPDPTLTDLIQKRNQVEGQIAVLKTDYSSTNVIVLRQKDYLDTLNREINAQIMGLLEAMKIRAQVAETSLTTRVAASAPGPGILKDPEDEEIQRIQTMIQNSPDLINAGAAGGAMLTPLASAAANGWIKVVNYLLAHGADVNANHSQALFSATRAGNRTMVELLLNHGADVNAADPHYWNATPLIVAAENNFRTVVEVLLTNNANVNVIDNQNRTVLVAAVEANHLEIAKLLLAAGASPNLKDFRGSTPLNSAIRGKHMEMVSLLLEQKADVNLKDNSGRTPLLIAADVGNAEIIKSLLDACANVNAENDEGRTPLSYAAENAAPEIVKLLLSAHADPNGGSLDAPLLAAIKANDAVSVKLLLEAGADPNMKCDVSWNDDIVSFDAARRRNWTTPLYAATSARRLSIVQLLLKFKADPNALSTTHTPLLFRALANADILEALLNAGAKVDVLDPQSDSSGRIQGFTPLFQAVQGGYSNSIVEILLNHGANPNVHEMIFSYAPLHYAAYNVADSNIFLSLLEHKADPNIQNNHQETPLSILKQEMTDSSNFSPEKKALAGQLADLLRQHGALDKLPDWNSIAVSRPSANFSSKVFSKGTNDWNHFSLLETLLAFYGNFGQGFHPPVIRFQGFPSEMPFPDLAHINIHRPQPGSTNETHIEANLLNSTNGIDFTKDVPLQFGDTVEIPEYNHPLASEHVGLTYVQFDAIKNYLTGKVDLMARGQKAEISFYFNDDASLIGEVLGQTRAQSILETSSDLSRVKVTRHDPQTGHAQSWILDCSDLNHPLDFRVQDGDVIEVPERTN